ncbi:hypothetical protein GALL_549290 [mine drainage metagenome]|uniref:Uncharacterized protein n=1 Tax=mine drainage metagenome TaxID=410659 RepID=A0A1J5NXM1_9ZZZZ
MHHVFIGGAGVGSNKVGNQKLLFPRLQRVLVKQRLEFVIAADARFHHLAQGAWLGVLGSDLQVTTHVVLHQFLDILGALHSQVITHT